MSEEYLLSLVLVLLVVCLALMRRNIQIPKESFVGMFMSRPALWWIVDADSNAGYVKVAYEALRSHLGGEFTITPLYGREAVLNKLSNPVAEAKQLPPYLWRLYATAALLEEHGGLVMDGTSTLVTGKGLYPLVAGQQAATFGVTPTEAIVSPSSAVAPGPAPYVAWAAAPRHPAWVYAADMYRKILARGPSSWSAAEARNIHLAVSQEQTTRGAVVLRTPDGGRLPNGKVRQLEDIFGRTGPTQDPALALQPGTVFISYDGDALKRRHEFNWFLRLTVEQIKSSPLYWVQYAGV